MTLPRGPRLAVVLGGIATAILLLAVGLSLYASTRRRSDRALCGANLRILYLAVRSGEPLESPKWEPLPPGRAFIAARDAWPTTQKRDFDPCCPVRGEHREIDYRGPALPLKRLAPGDPLFADRDGNHGPEEGGNAVLKSGALHACGRQDPLWLRAAVTTTD